MTDPTQCSNIDVASSGDGCGDRLAGASPGWWLHLRRCAQSRHVGFCDSSPSQHARTHFEDSGHPVIAIYEPSEEWFFDYRRRAFLPGPKLAAVRDKVMDAFQILST